MAMRVLEASGSCPSGHLPQPLYVLLQEVGGLHHLLMSLPSFGKGVVMWVFAP